MEQKPTVPQKFDQLNAADQEAYMQMQTSFRKCLYSKHKERIFPMMRQAIEYFVQKDQLKGVVCGFFKISEKKILVNNRQLQILLCCSKSQTNNLLQKSGLVSPRECPQEADIIRCLGLHQGDPLIKCWTYRTIPENLPENEPVNIDISIEVPVRIVPSIIQVIQ